VIEQFDEQLASDDPGGDDDFERSDLPRVARLGWGQQARLLAFAAAALFFVAAWVPWLVGVYSADGGGQATYVYVDGSFILPLLAKRLLNLPADSAARPSFVILNAAVSVLWAALTGLGIVLAPLLWRQAGSRAARWATQAYGIWLALASLLGVAQLGLLATHLAAPTGAYVWRLGAGVPLMALALGGGWGAWLRLRRAPPTARPAPVDDGGAARTRPWTRAAALATLGVAVWALGFFAIPWAADNCTAIPFSLNHFVDGYCAGLDSGDALSTLLGRRLSSAMWNVSVALYPLYGLLLAGALLAVLAVWRGGAALAARGWVACWLLAATGCALLASRGVAVIITQAPLLSFDSAGAWRRASGIPVTLAGLLLAWAGLLLLERAAAGTQGPHS
jgi:hypothetical protein